MGRGTLRPGVWDRDDSSSYLLWWCCCLCCLGICRRDNTRSILLRGTIVNRTKYCLAKKAKYIPGIFFCVHRRSSLVFAIFHLNSMSIAAKALGGQSSAAEAAAAAEEGFRRHSGWKEPSCCSGAAALRSSSGKNLLRQELLAAAAEAASAKVVSSQQQVSVTIGISCCSSVKASQLSQYDRSILCGVL